MLHIFNKRKFANLEGGMTYVELIVVLSIFAVISSVVMFDYGKFQDRVEVKNLVNDIALQIVEAQKSALAGKLYVGAGATWKPAYGLYFDEGTSNNKQFIYFADLDNSNAYNASDCAGGCLKTINITKGNYISDLAIIGTGSCSSPSTLSVVFTRPDARANIITNPVAGCVIDYVNITVRSPRAVSATIRVYPSGRVQIN